MSYFKTLKFVFIYMDAQRLHMCLFVCLTHGYSMGEEWDEINRVKKNFLQTLVKLPLLNTKLVIVLDCLRWF